ncbi:tetratricopeptide repeat protein [Streptomyces piniterrae]|uniref:Tetratricopeptide repeat protein n=1 Tax=Streptomyces piniterrae TaxID=2571125 RepID=A0A4U0NFU9_9ACTN|nr:tetratricopeptide repeat protein [Streptomyces piniterrae]TJZ53021.1 tetratricopeptide repeat protein [Streptomyces piniterrae]
MADVGSTHSELSGSATDVVQARDISGGVHFHNQEPAPRTGNSLPKPRQLPRDIRGFVNRSDELRQLNELLTDDGGEPLVVSICVVAGTAGVGKTSMSLRWAHRVQEHFPDGQLYVNLRGYDPGAPVTSQEVLHRFLSALGVPAKAIPAEPEAASALYRSLLAGRRMLIVLDNAATARQVRPLLPGTAGCLVLVTSRDRLSGLVVRDGARRVKLGTLDAPEAVTLLRAVTADYRSGDDEEKLAELARLCARLPLALRIAAERAAARPRMGLDELMRDLRDESALWDALSTGSAGDDEEADAVHTVFAWSYRALPEEAAYLFRVLGLFPGPEFGASAAAALAGVSLSQARHLLDVLEGAHLLEQTAPDRYEFHDLLRAYATDQAQQEETPEGRVAALRRVLNWYLHTADAAQTWINPHEAHILLDPPDVGVAPLIFSDYDEALNWYELERANLLAAARAAEEAGLDRAAWQMAAVLRSIHMLLSPFEEWLAMGQIGLRAAGRLGDRAAEAEILESLGMAYTQSHRLEDGARCHEKALDLCHELGDRLGEALSLNNIGLVCLRQRQLEDAGARFEQGLALFRELDAAHWESVVMSNLAEVRYEMQRLADAHNLIGRVLDMHRAQGNQGSTGNALRILSAVQRELGEPENALRSAQEAVDIARGRRNHPWEGYWLLELGAAQQANGRFPEALASYQRAAAVQRRLGDRSREARAWMGAGEAYGRIERFDEAAAFHRRAAAVHRELRDHWQLALALDGLAGACEALEREDESRQHRSEALGIVAAYEDPRAVRMRERLESALGRG